MSQGNKFDFDDLLERILITNPLINLKKIRTLWDCGNFIVFNFLLKCLNTRAVCSRTVNKEILCADFQNSQKLYIYAS